MHDIDHVPIPSHQNDFSCVLVQILLHSFSRDLLHVLSFHDPIFFFSALDSSRAADAILGSCVL